MTKPITLTAVEYRDIPGFTGYRVGSDGSVWTTRRSVKGEDGGRFTSTAAEAPTRLKQIVGPKGQIQVSLHAAGKTRILKVGRLVLLAFVGPPPTGHVCCHDDGDQSNNTLGNLRWATRVGVWTEDKRQAAATRARARLA